MKKRIISILLITVVLFIPLLTACGDGNDNGTQDGGSAANGNDTPANEQNNDSGNNPKQTTEEPVIEDTKLYITPFNVDNYPDIFVTSPELGTQAKIFSDLKTFNSNLGVEQDDRLIDMRYYYSNKQKMTVYVRGTNDNLKQIFIHRDDERSGVNTFGINGDLYIGANKNDVEKNYTNQSTVYYDDGYSRSYYDDYSIQINYFDDNNDIIDDITAIVINLPYLPILENRNYVGIYGLETSEPNTAGGVDVNIRFSNDSDKTIKYIYFNVTPYNAVDDVVSSEIGDRNTVSLELTGPIEPSDRFDSDTFISVSTENAWYNTNIKYAKLESVRIIYMDNEEVTLYVEE